MTRKGFKKNSKSKELDEQFEAFLKDSFSSEDSFNSAQINKYFDSSKKKESSRPWWDNDDDDDDQVGTSKSFLKKKGDKKTKKPDQPVKAAPVPKARKEVRPKSKAEITISKDSLDDISEKSEEDNHEHGRPQVHIPDSNRDSLDTDELMKSPSRYGIDTLDELADKEKFFQDLEENADGTIDYGRLNQELSATAHTLSPEAAARNAATLAAVNEIQDEQYGRHAHHNTHADALHSEREQSEQKPSMLSKVSLMDSLESTMNTTTSPQIGRGTLREAQDILQEEDEYADHHTHDYRPETLKTATGALGTNTSQEMEALHAALQKVGLSATIGNDSQILDLSATHDDKDSQTLVKKLLNASTGKQRSVSEIMKELEDLQQKVGETDHRKGPGGQFNIGEDLRGFALSPAGPPPPLLPHAPPPAPWDQDHSSHTSNYSHRGPDSQRGDSSHRGGFETEHTEETEMYQPVTLVSEVHSYRSGTSVNERGRDKGKVKKKQKKINNNKFNSSKFNNNLDTATDRKQNNYQDKTEANLRRSRSSSPLKIEFSDTTKSKLKTIKSSGYGQAWSPAKPPRETSRERDILGYSRPKPGTTTERDRSSAPVPSPRKDRADQEAAAHTQQTTKKQAGWNPVDVAKQKMKGSQSNTEAKLGTVATSQLDASIESFARYIKDHFSKTGQAPQVMASADEPTLSSSYKEKQPSPHLEQDTQLKDHQLAHLQGELEVRLRDYERRLETQRLEYEHQISQLKQQNFVRAAKGGAEETGDGGGRSVGGEDGELHKELKQQETLIAGYQQENQRVYSELKALQKQGKQTEENMFRENQKLIMEAATLRTQLEQKEEEVRTKGAGAAAAQVQVQAAQQQEGHMADLQQQLVHTQRAVEAANGEMRVLKQSKQETENHVEKLVMEREKLKTELQHARTEKSAEAVEVERCQEGEMEKLRAKLKWYAENQQMLDKGTRKLKLKDDEIHKLKMRVEELQTESGKRVEDSKVRARERAADAKKIQDLQRQVREMEAILKRRNPNSLPSLMLAAAAAPDPSTTPANQRSAYTDLLEQRLKKLEKQLDEKDSDSEQLIRGVEQKYNSVKLQFEERIKDLELQLSMYQGGVDHSHPHTHAVALERELGSVRERYKVQVADLQAQIDGHAAQTANLKKTWQASVKGELSAAAATEAELQVLVTSQQQEVDNKNQQVTALQAQIQQLRQQQQHSGKRQKLSNQGSDEPGSSPTAAREKQYEPRLFEDTQIAEVIKHNDELNSKVGLLHLHVEQLQAERRGLEGEREEALRQVRDLHHQEISALRTSHQAQINKVMANQALQHSTSHTAELQNKVDTQEVQLGHLREQQARLEVEAEAAAVLRIKQTRLEENLASLQQQLKEARKSHTPEMRHFESLQDKIVQMENKHGAQERELQQIITNTRHATSVQVAHEVDKWRGIVHTKNNEIERFRVELDSILEVLRVLQKQGVVIPVTSAVES